MTFEQFISENEVVKTPPSTFNKGTIHVKNNCCKIIISNKTTGELVFSLGLVDADGLPDDNELLLQAYHSLN